MVGAGKSGTTSLYHYLLQHPQIFMSNPKEPRFLSKGPGNNHNGPGDHIALQSSITTFEDYKALFKNAHGYLARGEASIENLYYHEYAIPNIKRYIGDPKIIIILRNPVARAYSAYSFLRRDGWEKFTFKDALNREAERKELGYKWMWFYREAGLYSRQVEAYKKNFTNVKIHLFDELQRDLPSLLHDLYTFLEVDPNFRPEISTRHNPSGIPVNALLHDIFVKPKRLHKIARTIGGSVMGQEAWLRLRERLRGMVLRKADPIPLEIAEELREFYRNDILRLEGLTGLNLSSWLERAKVA